MSRMTSVGTVEDELATRPLFPIGQCSNERGSPRGYPTGGRSPISSSPAGIPFPTPASPELRSTAPGRSGLPDRTCRCLRRRLLLAQLPGPRHAPESQPRLVGEQARSKPRARRRYRQATRGRRVDERPSLGARTRRRSRRAGDCGRAKAEGRATHANEVRQVRQRRRATDDSRGMKGATGWRRADR